MLTDSLMSALALAADNAPCQPLLPPQARSHVQDDYPTGMLRDASGVGLTPVDGAVLELQALLKAWVPALAAELGVLAQLLQPLLSRTGTPAGAP